MKVTVTFDLQGKEIAELATGVLLKDGASYDVTLQDEQTDHEIISGVAACITHQKLHNGTPQEKKEIEMMLKKIMAQRLSGIIIAHIKAQL